MKQTNTEIEFKDLPFSQKTRILLKRKSSINLTFFKKYFTIHAKVLPLRRFRMKVVLIGSLEGMGTKTQHTHTKRATQETEAGRKKGTDPQDLTSPHREMLLC